MFYDELLHYTLSDRSFVLYILIVCDPKGEEEEEEGEEQKERNKMEPSMDGFTYKQPVAVLPKMKI